MVMSSMFVCHFVHPNLRAKIIFKKEEAAENGGIDFEIADICTSEDWY